MPHVHARLRCGFDEFTKLFPSNHILAVSGNHLRKLEYLCELSGVEPVILGPESNKRIPPIWEKIGKQ